MRGTRLRGKGEKCKCRFARNKEFNGLLICGFADHSIVRHKKRELADIEWKRKWCPGWESNPHEEKSPEDFKSSASAIPPPGHRQNIKINELEDLVQHRLFGHGEPLKKHPQVLAW